MTGIERDGSGFVVPAGRLAEAFGTTEAEIAAAMRDGRMTSLCEQGVDADLGRWRLTFRLAGRACRFTVDHGGAVLAVATFPAGPRRGQPPG